MPAKVQPAPCKHAHSPCANTDLIEHAIARCKEAGLRRTRALEDVLHILIEARDPQTLADVAESPHLHSGADRATVVFGDIVNKTGIVPTSDFEAFRTRTRQKLMQSSYIRSRINFVENRARLENLQDRELVGSGRKPLDADRTFFLNGAMYRITRGNSESVNLYELSWELTRASDGSIVWSSAPYEIKQVR